MKKKYFVFSGVIIVLICVLFMLFKYKEKFTLISAQEYDKVIELGLEREGILNNQILDIQTVENNEKIVFFTKDNAIGLSCLSKDNNKWVWKRLDSIVDFQSEFQSSTYMSTMVNITTIKSNKYYLFMGKIFEPNIKKITLLNDKIDARIVTIDNNTFWFAIIDPKLVNYSYLDVNSKAYDSLGKIIQR